MECAVCLPVGLYVLLLLIFFLFILTIYSGRLSQDDLPDLFLRNFHQMVALWAEIMDRTFVFRFLKGRCHGVIGVSLQFVNVVDASRTSPFLLLTTFDQFLFALKALGLWILRFYRATPC